MKAEDYLHKAYRSIYDNDFEQAQHWFERALAVQPDHADIHYRYSITCARSSRLDKALQHARLASALDPGQEEYRLHYDRLQSMELARMAKRQLEEADTRRTAAAEPASRMLKRAVELDPLSVDAQVWLAVAYGELERYAEALQAVREAAALPLEPAVAAQLKEMEQRFKAKLRQSS
ncbi:tetratricopeptide repeat protein [Paenibacillus senegalimassiliensis]|uniref:tetratricopeptide repeat protein n=1 Tax=Paenibacillus senegalimassiliensis TaxID=1737426 RepID=UPI00073E425C|nr:tetratricopeptide repeat protein [Paenibacillus senegalimassiliensis]